MEKELNIAEILKEKPLGIKLWTDAFGEVTLDYVSKNGNGFNVKHHHGVLDKFLSNGKIYEEGTLCIYPSRNMRDWRKFAWKKGDVLVSNGEHIIFEKWKNNSYTTFLGLFDSIDNNSLICITSVWEKETNEVQINKYISQIEKDGGGKLNLETLEIEKPEFKDGDIVTIEETSIKHKAIIIYKGTGDIEHCLYRAYYIPIDDYLEIRNDRYYIKSRFLRLATDSEKRQLFAALEKDGKAWDTEKKTIVDLPKKCEFKAFDKVLVRDTKDEYWRPAFFASLDEDSINEYGYCLIGDPDGVFCKYCIPYNDQTAHLLGTTDDWKGGEA